MPLRAIFTCIPVLDIDVANAQRSNTPRIYTADYAPVAGPANVITIRAEINGPIVWTVVNVDRTLNETPATMGLAQQYFTHDVDDFTSECRINLNCADNVRAFGGFVKVTAQSRGLTRHVYVVVKPLVGANLNVVANHYAFEGAIQRGGNTIAGWYAYNLAAVPDIDPPASERTCNLTVNIQPNTVDACSHIEWRARTVPGHLPVALVEVDNNTRGIPLDVTRDVEVSVQRKVVTLAENPVNAAPVTIHVIDQPNDVSLNNNLELSHHSFDFAGANHFQVTQEDPVNFNLLYTSTWTAGALPTPQGYLAGTALNLNTVTVSSTLNPDADTHIDLRCTVYVKDAAGNLAPIVRTILNTVIPDPGLPPPHDHNLGNLDFGNLANRIRCYDPLLIFWDVRNAVPGGNEANDPGNPWFPLKLSFNRVYVTAQQRVAAVYPLSINANVPGNNSGLAFSYNSLLYMSCKTADGTDSTDADAVRDAIFGVFQPANPNPKPVRLNRSNEARTQLKYWDKYETGNAPAQSLNAPGVNLFTNGAGNIACGVWAELLIAMWALHGNNNGQRIRVRPRTANFDGLNGYPNFPADIPNPPGGNITRLTNAVYGSGFAVRHWNYNNKPGRLDADNFTHQEQFGRGIGPDDGVANLARAAEIGVEGQNNAMPPPSFGLHYIVLDTASGAYFDPSYGTHVADRDLWVRASIAGITNGLGNVGFVASAPGQPNDIDPNPLSIALFNEAAGAWMP
jgi:hypothetical protein